MQTWSDWGVDHIVIDNCGNANGTAQSVFEYTRIRDALVKVGTPPCRRACACRPCAGRVLTVC